MGEWRANKSVNRELIPLRQGDSERFVGIKKKKVHARARARAGQMQEKGRERRRDAGGTPTAGAALK
jgi:hypothetical protein